MQDFSPTCLRRNATNTSFLRRPRKTCWMTRTVPGAAWPPRCQPRLSEDSGTTRRGRRKAGTTDRCRADVTPSVDRCWERSGTRARDVHCRLARRRGRTPTGPQDPLTRQAGLELAGAEQFLNSNRIIKGPLCMYKNKRLVSVLLTSSASSGMPTGDRLRCRNDSACETLGMNQLYGKTV